MTLDDDTKSDIESSLEGIKDGVNYWRNLSFPTRNNKTRDNEEIDYLVQHSGYLKLLTETAAKRPLDEDMLNSALSSFTHVALSPRAAPFVSQSPDLIPPLIEVMRDYSDDNVGDMAITVLGSMALHRANHKNLMAAGILPEAIKLLRYLDQEGDHELDFGLTAVSLIYRLVGNEEDGEGAEAIQSNTKIVTKIHFLLDTVIKAGKNNSVFGFVRDPANIMLDISVLATSDRNKPQLVPFVELVNRSMEKRPDNDRLIKYSVATLSQLYFEPKCQAEFNKYKVKIIVQLKKVLKTVTQKSDRDTFEMASSLLASLEGKGPTKGGAPPPKLKGGMGTSFRFGIKEKETKKKQVPKHVMISYQWDHQALAKKLNEALTKAGIKTWFDLNDMGDNVNDSMAFAVENASMVLVLFSQAYKESANCRKECEFAHTIDTPTSFIKVDEDYNPSGWLGLVMGNCLWLPLFDPNGMGDCVKSIKQRIEENDDNVGGIQNKAVREEEMPAAEVIKDVREMMVKVTDTVKRMDSEIQALRNDVKTLKSDVHTLKEKTGLN